MDNIKVLIITGSVGVGKSSVADAVSAKLTKLILQNALIDLDFLRYAFPRPINDPFHRKLGMNNLASIYPNYTNIGVEYFIIPNLVENQKDIDDIQNAMAGSGIFITRLTASIETIHYRIRNRELGGSLEWHLDRATVLSEELERSKLENIVIDTNSKTIDHTADIIIEKWLKQ